MLIEEKTIETKQPYYKLINNNIATGILLTKSLYTVTSSKTIL